MIDPKIFHAYDIRAIIPKELDEEGIAKIAEAVIGVLKPQSVQVGRDMRTTSPMLHKAFVSTFLKYGVNVVDLGLISTDMLYFAAGTYNEDLAINVSASHNPGEYNGLKIVRKGAAPLKEELGIKKLKEFVEKKQTIEEVEKEGAVTKRDIMDEWITHLLSFVAVSKMKPLTVAIDTANGMAGHFMPQLEKHLPWKVERMFYELDGTFPNHPASPIEAKNMQYVVDKVKEIHADVGMSFDGDGDRVFLVDENGEIVSGTVMTAIIADNLLRKNSGETILYNAIVGRIVPEIVKELGGKTRRVKVGHIFIKADMREHDAIFAGEHSGHYYFRDNFYADSAIIAALLVLEMMSVQNVKLSELASKYNKYPSSGELNFKVEDKDGVMKAIENEYKGRAESVDWLDGVSIWFKDYWLNVRASNTEPLLRLNIEADTQALLDKVQKELTSKLTSLGAKPQE